MIRLAFLVGVALATSACGPGSPGGPTINNHIGKPDPVPQSSSVISAEILSREPLSNNAMVKHILIGWADTDDKDPRAVKRSKADAEAQIRTIVKQLEGGAEFDAMMREFSDDPGSAKTGTAYAVSPDAQLVIEFKQLGLRLKVGEVGVVQSDFGFHIMKRVQ